MGAPTGSEVSVVPDVPDADAGIYLDSSALAKLYVPEPESDGLDRFLHGRRDILISDLAVTEVMSAILRRRREGALNPGQAVEIRDALLSDADSDFFRRLELNPVIHREAERLLFSLDVVALRTLDALHVALARLGSATHIVTYDMRMQAAALRAGLKVLAPE